MEAVGRIKPLFQEEIQMQQSAVINLRIWH